MMVQLRLITLCSLIVLVVCAGCVSMGTEKRLGPGDLSAVVGTWTGYVQIAAVGSRAVEVTIHPDGSFVSFHSASRSVGSVAIVDGKLEIQGQTGRTAHRSTATLYERNGKQVLVGTGHSKEAGPYSFEYQKAQVAAGINSFAA